MNPVSKRALVGAMWVVGMAPAVKLFVSLRRINEHFINAYDYRVFTLAIADTGTWAFVFLYVTLSCRPLQRLTGARWIVGLRRTFGLLTFFYSMLHFGAYFVIGQKLHAGYLVPDALDKKSRIPGWISLAILVALALTSTDLAIRRMGGRLWKAVHRFVYVAAALAIWHVAASEADYLDPDWHATRNVAVPFAVLMLARLLFRLPRSARV
jgi:DMSO/TMAO reductase YedYZ heme-binding membrane subunit